MTKKKSKPVGAGYNTVIISTIIMAAAVLWIFYVAMTAGLPFIIYALPYAVALLGSYAFLKDKVTSESLQRIIILLNIVGAVSVLFFLWSALTFIQNYTW